ncbi:hypothetical protein L798_04127, partial [Zootermopsis nevadensis]
KWRIKINVNKCSVALFSKRLTHLCSEVPPLKIFGATIPRVNEVKYLGVILDRKLAYRSHISKAVCRANHRLRQLYPILTKSSSININLALKIYKTLLRPIITYAAPAWGYAAKTHISKLQVFQNKVLRIITKLPWVTAIEILHEKIGIATFRYHVRKIANKFY